MKVIPTGLLLAAGIALLVTSFSVGSGPDVPRLKIGYVEQQRVFRETLVGKAAQQELKALQEKKQAEIDRREKELKDIEEKIANEALPLTQEARDNLKRDRRKKRAELDIFVTEAYEEADKFNKEKNEEFEKMMAEVSSQVAKNLGYSIILERIPIVLYGNPEFDLTDQMIRMIDEMGKKKQDQEAE